MTNAVKNMKLPIRIQPVRNKAASGGFMKAGPGFG